MAAFEIALSNPASSTRQTGSLRFQLLDNLWLKLEEARASVDETEDRKPNRAAVECAVDLFAEMRPLGLLGDPAISPFCGELHLLWNNGDRQLVLMCFSEAEKNPLLHHYEHQLRQPPAHAIVPA